ncbi:hypothetical protein IU500_23025 [Nocardia terpenica]|uniref:Uncharacterized protein n=1 Tax=Nocardia terpenica TaxID=455432 RepID=A0A164MWS1_9NOCA|nr:hypothetical protein [Nocardia terpenica]KZM73742.1 hypothetical protein AWN90_34795 [Nocardia terpenica]MBF6064461.1 hypothetical protein [Nocardia terpenica]MBF6106915.1 hypothetical protein [Nocardia terpenica]MBF6114429.1 hypothetical protein [Nocardia terpenica]MBF6121485.1 hypothetical protein [Nocardia terpenica]
MPARFVPQPQPGTADSATPPSRRERRGAKSAVQQQPFGGKVNNNGRAMIPARKHNNYRRG